MSQKKHPWYKQRRYLHFDLPVSRAQASSLVKRPVRVAKHSFYPFIQYINISYKIQKDKATGAITKKPKKRPISYAAHKDSHLYSYYSHRLISKYERAIKSTGIDDSVLAFRAIGQSNIDFAFRCFEYIRSLECCTAIAIDVTDFFGSMKHDFLKHKWIEILGEDTALPEDHYAVYKSITKYSYVNRKRLFQTLQIPLHNPKGNRRRVCTPKEFRELVREGGLIERNESGRGIPQGSPVSSTLSNIYMFEFDLHMQQAVRALRGNYWRYCDDIMIVIPGHESGEIVDYVNSELDRHGLSTNSSKTHIRDFNIVSGKQHADKFLQYLGFTYNGGRILLRSAALARFSEKMKRGVRIAKNTRIKRNKRRISRGESPKPTYRKKIYQRYSYLGRRNFTSYAFRAARTMNSKAIKKQMKPLWKKLLKSIE